jgi:uncharacterized protein DUF5753
VDEETPEESLSQPPVFGIEVREVRTAMELTQKHVAKGTGYSEAYVCKVEAGQQFPSEKFAQGCDLVFGTRGMFERLRQRILDDESPSWFEPYLRHERKASHIMDYSTTLVMGILQTEEYARAIFRSSNTRDGKDVIDGKVAKRLRRREIFKKDHPPLLWVILHEACLHTVVGSKGIMSQQLEHLLTSAESPDIELQVLPFAAGAPVAHMKPFIVLRFKKSPSLLYTESQLGGRLAYSPETVGPAQDDYDRIRANALSPSESLVLIKTVLEEYRT